MACSAPFRRAPATLPRAALARRLLLCGAAALQCGRGASGASAAAAEGARGLAEGGGEGPGARGDRPTSASSESFWDRTYEVHGAHGREAYEWYAIGFRELSALLAEKVPSKGDVLVVGAGDSELSAQLAEARGPTGRVVSIDFSARVVERMSAKHPHLEFHRMDARNMSFSTSSFAAAVDKGLSDCLDPAQLPGYFRELRRVLAAADAEGAPAGVAVVVSMRPLEGWHFGPGWSCEPTREHMGPQFVSVSEHLPAQPVPGSEGSIPYYVSVCHKEADVRRSAAAPAGFRPGGEEL